jgi:hypothetical protein
MLKLAGVAHVHRIVIENWKYGFAAMRNYCVPAGCLVRTPEVIRLSTGGVIRPSEELCAGPAALSGSVSATVLSRVLQIVVFNAVCFVVACGAACSWLPVLCTCFGGIILARLERGLLFWLGSRRLLKMTAYLQSNTFSQASSDLAALASQPSTLHNYWMMKFDIPIEGELCIQGIVNCSEQKYWSIVVYDEYGISIGQVVYHNTVTRIPIDNTRSLDEAYSFDVRLIVASNSSFPSPHPHPHAAPVTRCRVPSSKGYALFRQVHPAVKAVRTDESPPSTEAIKTSLPPATKLVNLASSGNKGGKVTKAD